MDKQASKNIVHAFLESAVDDEAERFYTDEHAAYEGFEVNSEGDGFMLAFPRAR